MNVPSNSVSVMARHLGLTTLLLASLAAMPVLSSAACAELSAASSSRHQTSATKQHRVVTVVTQVSEKG